MDPNQVVAFTGLALATVNSIVQAYATFRRSNVEEFFRQLVEERPDLRAFESDEQVKRRFFGIVDKVSLEANIEKIERWKNATLHLATDFSDFRFADEFIRCLTDLTVFDLTVLQKIYSTDFGKPEIEQELIGFFENRQAPRGYVVQSLKQLASHNLLEESYDRTAVVGRDDRTPILGTFHYTKNALGQEFLRFIMRVDTEE